MTILEMLNSGILNYITILSFLLSSLSLAVAVSFFRKSSEQVAAAAKSNAMVGEFTFLALSKQNIFQSIRELKTSIENAQSIITDYTDSDRRRMLVEDIKQMSASLEHMKGVDQMYESMLQETKRELNIQMAGIVVTDEEQDFWDRLKDQPQESSTKTIFHRTPLFTAMIYKMVEETNSEFLKGFQQLINNSQFVESNKPNIKFVNNGGHQHE